MKSPAIKSLVIMALSAASFSVFASSDDDSCTKEPKSAWMSAKDVQAMYEKQGYNVRRIKTEGSCYEIYTKDKDGKKVELLINPADGSMVREPGKS